MGAWGTAPFDNNDAMDFFGEVEDTEPVKALLRLREALSATAERPGYLEVDEANVAVAAAAMVAASRGRVPSTGVAAVDAWLSEHRLPAEDADQQLALRALERCCGADSEWLELWREAGQEAAVRANLDELRASLRG